MPASEKPAIAVSITWNAEPWLRRFRAMAPGREVIEVTSPDMPLPERYYLFAWKPARALMHRQPAPLMICSAGAGVDHILLNDPPPGIPITRIVDPDLTGRMVEYVVLHALLHLRRMTDWPAHNRARSWKTAPFPAVREVTVGIMGVGEMGQAAAKGLLDLGFNVIGWGRTHRDKLPFKTYAGEVERAKFLSQTDILVNLLPSTPETRGIISTTLLTGLRRTGPFGAPVLINAGRGDACNEDDVAQALTDGTLRAASLDVFITEPLPAASPFWSLDNCIVTPHNAADSHPDAVAAAVVEEIRRFEAGEPLLNPVDPARGY